MKTAVFPTLVVLACTCLAGDAPKSKESAPDKLEAAKQAYHDVMKRQTEEFETARKRAEERLLKQFDSSIQFFEKKGDRETVARLTAEKECRLRALAVPADPTKDTRWATPCAVIRGEGRASQLISVADDFIVNIYHNGVVVPDEKRQMLEETFGALTERIELDVRQGDWLVFNVVNNRLRWGGAHYFAVAGMTTNNEVSFTSELESDLWSCCDDPSEVERFIADPHYLEENKAVAINIPWDQGDTRMQNRTGNWTGSPLWGHTRNTWIKYQVP